MRISELSVCLCYLPQTMRIPRLVCCVGTSHLQGVILQDLCSIEVRLVTQYDLCGKMADRVLGIISPGAISCT